MTTVPRALLARATTRFSDDGTLVRLLLSTAVPEVSTDPRPPEYSSNSRPLSVHARAPRRFRRGFHAPAMDFLSRGSVRIGGSRVSGISLFVLGWGCLVRYGWLAQISLSRQIPNSSKVDWVGLEVLLVSNSF